MRPPSPRVSTSPTLDPQPSTSVPPAAAAAAEQSENVRNLKQKLSMLKGVFPLAGGRATHNTHTNGVLNNNNNNNNTHIPALFQNTASALPSGQTCALVLEDVDETDKKTTDILTPRVANPGPNDAPGFGRTASNESVGAKNPGKPGGVVIPPLALGQTDIAGPSESGPNSNGSVASDDAAGVSVANFVPKVGFKANVFDRLTAQRNLVAACKAR